MKRVLKWVGYAVAGVLAVVCLVAGGIFVASEVMIRMPQQKPASRLVAASGPAAVARGHLIATRMGCADCHGADLRGRMFDDLPGVARLYAPNLTLVVGKASDADLDRAIRHGVGVDGRPLWVMPSATYAHLTDAETADLLAWLRTTHPAGPPQPRPQFRSMGRLGAVMGKFKPEAVVIKAHDNPTLPDFGRQYAEGRNLARACVECHGPALEGAQPPVDTPDLAIAAAYEPEDFAGLMRTGKAAGGRELRLMSATARSRFSNFSDREVAALLGYLQARAANAVKVAATKPLPKP